jgi:hypothetical protein
MLTQEQIRVLETLEKHLKATRFGRKRFPLPGMVVAVPERIVKGLGRQPDHVRVWDQMCPELRVENVGRRLADVG